MPTAQYYSDHVEVTGNLNSLEEAFTGGGASAVIDGLIETLDQLATGGQPSTTFKFLTKTAGGNAVSNVVTQAIVVSFDDATGKYTVNDLVIDTLGSTAAALAIAAVLPGLSGIAGVMIAGAASALLWSSVDAAATDVINLINGTVPVDMQLLDSEGNVTGGAFYDAGLSATEQLDAARDLIIRGFSASNLPKPAEGMQIRLVEDANFSASVADTYTVYDGSVVDDLAEELGINKSVLLSFGAQNAPNKNSQIYYESGSDSVLFANEDNELFIPVPKDDSGSTQVLGFHPSRILTGDHLPDVLVAGEVPTVINNGAEFYNPEDGWLISGGGSIDRITGSKANDALFGGDGTDFINGGKGDDTLWGGEGEDYLVAGGGLDLLIGDKGGDVLVGGA